MKNAAHGAAIVRVPFKHGEGQRCGIVGVKCNVELAIHVGGRGGAAEHDHCPWQTFSTDAVGYGSIECRCILGLKP